LAWAFAALALFFCLKNFYFNIPMVDFRPFAEGTNIPVAKEKCLADAPVKELTFIYKNKASGETQKFDMNNLPTGDGWEYVDREERVIKEGCNSQIQYFEMPEIEDHQGYSFLVVSGDLDYASKDAFKKIGEIAKSAESSGIPTHAMYYHYKGEVDMFRQEVNGAYPFHAVDDKLTKTIVRANPGLVLVHNGVILKKWHHRHIPTYEDIRTNYMK